MNLPGRLGSALRSLRWRLTLTFLALIAVLLAALGAFQYVALRLSLIGSRVNVLQSDLAAAQRVYTADHPAGLTATERMGQLAALVSQSSGAAAVVALYGPTGARVLVRPAGDDPPQLSTTAFAAVVSRHVQQHEVADTPGGRQLVAGFPVSGDPVLHRVAAVIEISESLAPVESVLAGDLKLLAVGGSSVLVLVLVLGLLLTRRALSPLRRLTATAGALAQGDLRARSRLAPSDSEVGRLAGAFDHMAERIEGAFTAQRESEARVRRFIADASHELRTPVTALSGYVDVLRRGAARDPEALSAALSAMARESGRLRALVLDLLTLARLDATPPQPVAAVDLGAALARLLAEGVPGMPAEVVRDLPAQPVIARCDPAALATVVRNLLANACAYAPGARQVWSVRTDRDRARLDAHDDGPGIPASDLGHVFERFYRGEKTRTREEGGSGLGLAIVQGLVRAQGGEVAIASAEGAGTTVTVWLPLAATVPPGPSPQAPAGGPPRRENPGSP